MRVPDASNRHDLDAIMSGLVEDAVFESPSLARLTITVGWRGTPSGGTDRQDYDAAIWRRSRPMSMVN